MKEMNLNELVYPLQVLLQDDSVLVRFENDRIKVFPLNDEGEISHLYPICQPTIKRIIWFCSEKNLSYFIAEDVYTTCICFQIYQNKLG